MGICRLPQSVRNERIAQSVIIFNERDDLFDIQSLSLVLFPYHSCMLTFMMLIDYVVDGVSHVVRHIIILRCT